MVKTYSKMYRTNADIKKYLTELKFEHIFHFPHSRFSKDYVIMECGFDAIAWKFGIPWLLQFKSNKKVSQSELERYREIEKRLNCKCAWVNRIDRKGIEFYDTDYSGFFQREPKKKKLPKLDKINKPVPTTTNIVSDIS